MAQMITAPDESPKLRHAATMEECGECKARFYLWEIEGVDLPCGHSWFDVEQVRVACAACAALDVSPSASGRGESVPVPVGRSGLALVRG